MIAPRSTTHAADTLALLTSAYKGRTVIEAILRAGANRTQALETALWAMVDAMQVPGVVPAIPAARLNDTFYSVNDVRNVDTQGQTDARNRQFFLRAITVTGNSADPATPMPAGLRAGDTFLDGTAGVGVTWQLFSSGMPFGTWLDALGELAGETRGSRPDEEYLAAVKVRLRVNRSQGQTVDVLDVMSQILGPSGAWTYYEDPQVPDCFRVDVYSTAIAATLRALLGRTRAGGVRAEIGYTGHARAGVMVGGEQNWGYSGNASGVPFGSVEVAT